MSHVMAAIGGLLFTVSAIRGGPDRLMIDAAYIMAFAAYLRAGEPRDKRAEK